MIERGLGDFFPTQHPGYLPIAVFFAQRLYRCQSSTAGDMLGYAEMVLAEFGDLGQMRNTDHLVMSGKFGQLATDHFRRAAADGNHSQGTDCA